MMSLLEYADSGEAANTQKAIKQGLANFLEYIYSISRDGKRTNHVYLELDDISRQYLTEERNHSADLLGFISHMSDRRAAPVTIRNTFSQVCVWLEWNDIVIAPSKLKLLKKRLPRMKTITKRDENLTPEKIREITNQMSVPMAALVQVLMSSGMRIGEASRITEDDVDWTSSPVEVTIREEYTKTKTRRYTFISSEAAQAVKSWLQIKPDWLQSVKNIGKGIGVVKNTDDPRVFPMSEASICRSFVIYIGRAGYHEKDERTGRATISPHLFRAYFISQMKTAMSPDMVEFLAGHGGYLPEAYRKYNKQQVKDAYLSAEFAVSLNVPANMTEIKEAKDRADYAMSEYLRQSARITTMEHTMEDMTRMMEEYREAQRIIKRMKSQEKP